MDTILKNDTLNTVMSFIKSNIWIIGLLLAIVVVIILIIIFSKKRPVEIESTSNDNVGDLMNVNPSLENSTNIINTDEVNAPAPVNAPESLNEENLETPVMPVTEEVEMNVNTAVTPAPVNLETTPVSAPEETSAINADPISSEPEIPEVVSAAPTYEEIKETSNLNMVDDNVLNNNLMNNDASANVVVNNPINNAPAEKEDLNAFDLPMPAQNTEVVNNFASVPKEETLTETLEEKPVKAEEPENFTAPEVTDLEDTLELPKMANEAINENITATKKCPNCGHDNPYSYKVCVKCGTILE